jgi:hypothetical protein
MIILVAQLGLYSRFASLRGTKQSMMIASQEMLCIDFIEMLCIRRSQSSISSQLNLSKTEKNIQKSL